MRRRITLTSIPMIHTPGLLAWGQNGYKFKRDQGAIRDVFIQGYGLPENVAHELLTGDIPHTVEDENVVFEAEMPEGWEPSK